MHPTVSQQLSPVVLALKLRLGLIELKIPVSGSPWKAHKLETRSVKAQPWPQLAAVGAIAGGTASPAAPGEAQEQTAPCVRGHHREPRAGRGSGVGAPAQPRRERRVPSSCSGLWVLISEARGCAAVPIPAPQPHPDPRLSLSPQTAQRKIREIVQQVKQQEQKHAQGAPASQHSK